MKYQKYAKYACIGMAVISVASIGVVQRAVNDQLPTGKRITPVGSQIEVGSFPVNMVASADNKYLFVSDAGYREFLTSIRVSDGKVVSSIKMAKDATGKLTGLYFGMAVLPGGLLAVSRGAEDKIAIYKVDSSGVISDNPQLIDDGFADPAIKFEVNPAGVACDSTGQRLYVANNQTGAETNLKGSLTILDTRGNKPIIRVPTGGYPYAVAAITYGKQKDQKVYVSSERDSLINVIDPRSGKMIHSINVGSQPIGLTLDASHKRLYVCNAGSDTISVINTDNDKVEKTILVRPDDVRDIPGSTPTSSALSPDGKRLFVTLGDMNAVVVIDLVDAKLVGYIPVGWYPTSIWVSPDGAKLFVANAKGTRPKNPNGMAVGDRGRYIQNIIEGTVSIVEMPSDAALSELTLETLKNNRIAAAKVKPDDILKNPGIEHIIYVIKENRTYDQVLGDLPQGNGDSTLCLFPRQVTPNQHALAERFALLDNFYDCAEVSADGWNWSTSGMANEHTVRNAPYSYSGRGRVYDYEGQNNGVPVDLLNVPDVAKAPGDYIWDNAMKHGKSIRNYGFFVSFVEPGTRQKPGQKTTAKDNAPNKRSLVGKTDLDFRLFDADYPDSDAYAAHGVSYPKIMKQYGKHRAPSRFAEWKQEFTEYVKHKNLPHFSMIRFGNDHTNGTSTGHPSPQAMVADNDYALGQLVEAVSASPYWKSTAIFVLEDDAQNGFDHVDAHRSIAFVISPFVHRSTVDHRFFNTDSVLRTMELLLGLPPMTQYDAVASVFKFFDREPANFEKYTAILPDRSVLSKINTKTAYKSEISNKLNFKTADAVPDAILNDLIWHSVKGNSVPIPGIRTNIHTAAKKDADD